MNPVSRQMHKWGPLGVSLCALVVAAVAVLAIYTNAPTALDSSLDVKPGDTVVFQPATGPEGYDAGPFCADPLTRLVAREPVPSTDLTTYTLERLRDGKQELVVWRDAARGAEHWFFDAAGVQQRENAYVDSAAKDCILAKPLEPRP